MLSFRLVLFLEIILGGGNGNKDGWWEFHLVSFFDFTLIEFLMLDSKNFFIL